MAWPRMKFLQSQFAAKRKKTKIKIREIPRAVEPCTTVVLEEVAVKDGTQTI